MNNLLEGLNLILLGGALVLALISLGIALAWLRPLSNSEQRIVGGFLTLLYSGAAAAVAFDHPQIELASGIVIAGVPWLIFFWFLWVWNRP
jgi:hypothetical protein